MNKFQAKKKNKTKQNLPKMEREVLEIHRRRVREAECRERENCTERKTM